MGNLDKDKVLHYRAEIKEAQNTLAEITSVGIDQFICDPMKIKAMKYTMIVLVEAMSNLCRHILAKKTHTVVEEYMEAILKMHEKGILSEEIMKQLVPLTKLRHQLIHGYWKTDDRRLFLETRDNLKTIDRFLSEIRQLVPDT